MDLDRNKRNRCVLGWRRRRTKKPPRSKRRERLNWHQWLADWYKFLRLEGYICQNKRIGKKRFSVTAKGLLNIPALYMVKGDHGVYLYSSADAVPPHQGFERWPNRGEALPTSICRIVQGRRRDPSRGVTRLESTLAIGIVPKIDLHEKEPFFVDFDEGLFQFIEKGVWKETQDEKAAKLYADYLYLSAHYRSIRPYGSPKQDCPTGLPILLSDCKTDDAPPTHIAF